VIRFEFYWKEPAPGTWLKPEAIARAETETGEFSWYENFSTMEEAQDWARASSPHLEKGSSLNKKERIIRSYALRHQEECILPEVLENLRKEGKKIPTHLSLEDSHLVEGISWEILDAVRQIPNFEVMDQPRRENSFEP
jgi:hypothetical protein